MVAPINSEDEKSLRETLKEMTASLHDRLDAQLACRAIGARSDYGAFLSVQYAARAPIERWVANECRPDLRPPAMAGLIAADLADLGLAVPVEMPFAMPGDADPLGLAWALGGSARGNRSMLAARRKAGMPGPDRFLSDPTMAQFFVTLLPRLDRRAGNCAGPVAAANAVFATFLAASDTHAQRAAA